MNYFKSLYFKYKKYKSYQTYTSDKVGQLQKFTRQNQ